MTEIEHEDGGRTPTCFVIGPIGNRHAAPGSEERLVYEEALQVYEEIIEAACSMVALEPVRADGLHRAGEITEQVFRRLRDDDVVIADVTGANPNVMYELGLRHTRDKITLQVGEYGRLPFDVNVIRTVQFSRSPHGLIRARDELVRLLEAALAGEADPVSATRVWNEASGFSADAPSAPEEVGVEERDNEEDVPGFLDVLVEGEAGWETLQSAADRIAQAVEAMGALANRGAEEIAKSDAQGRGMKGRLAIVARHANSLSGIADDLEEAVSEYERSMNAVSAATLAVLDHVEQDPAQLDVEPGRKWGLALRALARTSRETLSSLSEMVASIEENARIARVLREPSRRITNALRVYSQATALTDEWDRRLQALGIPEPPEDWSFEDDDATSSSTGS